MKAKITCWMIKAPRGWLGHPWASYTRRGCIEAFMKDCPKEPSWKVMYRRGWRAVRVNCIEA